MLLKGAVSNVGYSCCEPNYIGPSQIPPFFTNPAMHWQVYDPSLLLHTELGTAPHRSSICAAHSSISGPGCSMPDQGNPGLARILISVL